MSLDEAISRIESEEHYTDENISNLWESLKETDPSDFKDANVVKFMKFINKKDFDPRIQTLVVDLVKYMDDKGVQPPCLNGCDDGCAFHEAEFGDKK